MKRLLVALALMLAMAFAGSPASADPGTADGASLDLPINFTWE